MNKEDIKKAVIQALVEDEYQENTNYNDIADSVIRILEEKNTKWNQFIINNGMVNEQIHINNHTGNISL